jgi:multidrug efflux pump subunit AcrB
MWIVRLALRRPYTIAVLSALILIFGVLTGLRTNADIFPAIDIPVVIVVWNYPGLSTEDMERRVVLISERAFSTTVDGIARIESQSIAGVGILKVYFEQGADIGGAIAQIASVSATASRIMPPGMAPPTIIRFNASNVPVAQLTVASKRLTEQEIFDYGLNFIRVRLFTIPGMSIPAPYGGKQRQIMVDVDPARVAARGLSVQDVVQAVLQSNVLVPAGSAEIGDTEYDVALNSSPTAVEQFEAMPVRASAGAPVFLGDVARVRDGFAVQQNIVHVNGSRATYLAILKHSNASTLAVVDATRDLLPAVRAAAPEGTSVELQFDQSLFVRAAIANVLHEGAISTLLVGLLVLFFLGSWRSTLIVATSIPLSILVGVTGLSLLGQTFNLMTLGGLALAIGMLVDDATVTVENVHRHLALGKALTPAIVDAAREIAVPALAATLTICIVFFPVVLLTGPARFLFTALAIAVVISMLASYLLSRTLVPSMARLLLPGERHGAEAGARPSRWRALNAWRDRAFARLQDGYVRLLETLLHHRGLVLGTAAALMLVTGALLLVVGSDFFPTVDTGQMRLHFRAPVGTRIGETERMVLALEDRIRSVIPAQELETVNDSIGVPIFYNLAFVSTDNIGTQDAEILVALRPPHRPTAHYRRRIRELFREFPGCDLYFQPADIVGQVLNFGLPAPVDVQVEGADLRRSAEVARVLRDRLLAIPGMADVRIAQVLEHPALFVEVDRARAAQVGLTERDVASNLLTTLSSSSLVAPSFWVNPRNNVNYIVAVQTPRPRLDSVSELLATPVGGGLAGARRLDDAGAGTSIPLGAIARVRPAQDMAMVSHQSVQRVVDVLGSVEGRDLGSVASDIDRAIASVELPPGVRVSVRGQIESMRTSFRSLGLGLLLASALVYLLLVVLFQSWLDPFIIVFAVPGALTGIGWALALTGSTLNVESFMGSIMAVGLAVSNSILLVSFANEVRAAEPMDAGRAAILAGRTRLRPVLMTALAMIAGMLPMALALGEGGEQNAPLGRAVIGGLVAATAVTLLVVPLVYSLLRREPPRAHALDERFQAEMAEPAAPAGGGHP